jgi:hypothetical protein
MPRDDRSDYFIGPPDVDEAAPLICTLEIASLDDDLDFAALSYVWGDTSVAEEITVQGLTALRHHPRLGSCASTAPRIGERN